MTWVITRYEGFLSDIREWQSSDASLGDEMIRKCESIEQNPMKGEKKIGGPIAGCRSVYLRSQKYAIIYENVPNSFNKDNVEEIKFRGVTKHDNQANAWRGTDDPHIAMKRFELLVPGAESRRLYSAFKDSEGIYLVDDQIDWDYPTTFEGQFERRHEDTFQSLASEGEIQDIERVSLREILEMP